MHVYVKCNQVGECEPRNSQYLLYVVLCEDIVFLFRWKALIQIVADDSGTATKRDEVGIVVTFNES